MSNNKLASSNYIIFIGNPGAGKSTLLNSLIGQVKFEAGVALGKGLTAVMQLVQHGDTIYGDTPGLSDVVMRKKAAEEINKILKHGGLYKLCFIVTIEAGRVRPDDLTTIKLVLDSIEDDTLPYGIIVNKVGPRIMNASKNEAEIAPLLTSLNHGHRPTDMVLFLPFIKELDEADNRLVKPDSRLVMFLELMTSKLIVPSSVKDIEIQDFENMREGFERQLAELKNDMKLQQEFYERQNQELRDQGRQGVFTFLGRLLDELLGIVTTKSQRETWEND